MMMMRYSIPLFLPFLLVLNERGTPLLNLEQLQVPAVFVALELNQVRQLAASVVNKRKRSTT